MYRFSIYNVILPVHCHRGIVEVHMFCTLTFELVHCVKAVTITVFPSKEKKVRINPEIFTFSNVFVCDDTTNQFWIVGSSKFK